VNALRKARTAEPQRRPLNIKGPLTGLRELTDDPKGPCLVTEKGHRHYYVNAHMRRIDQRRGISAFVLRVSLSLGLRWVVSVELLGTLKGSAELVLFTDALEHAHAILEHETGGAW
jgi:hypothetical protein